jgi:hypothetical protein
MILDELWKSGIYRQYLPIVTQKSALRDRITEGEKNRPQHGAGKEGINNAPPKRRRISTQSIS